jgi:hypothetical protein
MLCKSTATTNQNAAFAATTNQNAAFAATANQKAAFAATANQLPPLFCTVLFACYARVWAFGEFAKLLLLLAAFSLFC